MKFNNYLIFFFLLCFSFLLITCSNEVMLDLYDYKGDMDDIINDSSGKLDVTFSGTSTISLDLCITTWDGDREISFNDGSYFVESNYYFCADIKEDVDYNIVLWKNIIDSSGIEDMDDIDIEDYDSIELKLELEGYLNSYEGKGEGDYKMRCWAELETGEVKKGEVKGDWVLVRK